MASSSDAIKGLGATQMIIPPGNTNAVFVDVQPREGAMLLKYFSGGTLEIQGAPNGTTLPGTSLVLGSGYILGESEVLSLTGAPRFYLLATGSTTIACILRGLTDPGYNSTTSADGYSTT